MKKGIVSLFCLFVFVFLTSCTNIEAPKSVAEKFLNATSQKKFKEAKQYCTKETKYLLDIMEGMDSIRPNYRKHKTNEYKVLSEKIDGDAAFVKYKEKGDEKEQTIKLKKEDGKWLVAFSKADMKGKGEIMNKEDEPFEMDAKMDKDSAKVDTGTVK